MSTFAHGRLSRVNDVAARQGAVIGMSAQEFVEQLVNSRRAALAPPST
jgi:hypothetical protein